MKLKVVNLNEDGTRKFEEFNIESDDKIIITTNMILNQDEFVKLTSRIRTYFESKDANSLFDLRNLSIGVFDMHGKKEPIKVDEKYKKLVDIIEQLESCNYRTADELHSLNDNMAFIALKQLAMKEINDAGKDNI